MIKVNLLEKDPNSIKGESFYLDLPAPYPFTILSKTITDNNGLDDFIKNEFERKYSTIYAKLKDMNLVPKYILKSYTEEDDLFIKNNLRKIISLFFNQYVDPSKVDYKQGILLKLYNEPIN